LSSRAEACAVAAGRWAAIGGVQPGLVVFGLPVVGYDRLSSGTAQMRWRLLGLLPVMTAAGPDITRSAAGRLAGELVPKLSGHSS